MIISYIHVSHLPWHSTHMTFHFVIVFPKCIDTYVLTYPAVLYSVNIGRYISPTNHYWAAQLYVSTLKISTRSQNHIDSNRLPPPPSGELDWNFVLIYLITANKILWEKHVLGCGRCPQRLEFYIPRVVWRLRRHHTWPHPVQNW